MSRWNPVVITEKGLALQAKVEKGIVLEFTRMALGSGKPSDLSKATNLANKKQDLDITSKKSEDNTCTIYGTSTNINVTTGYVATELGIFAKDPDVGEILFAVTTDDAPDTVPQNTSATVVTQRIGVTIAMSRSTDVSVVVSTSGMLTPQDAENIATDIKDKHAKQAVIDHPDGSVTEKKLADLSVSTRTLQSSGVTPGTYRSVTVDRTGRVMQGSNPSRLGDYGITDAYTKTESDNRFVNVTKTFVGATSNKNGESGLVPAPGRGETKNRFLRADGTWAVVPDLTGATSSKAGTGGLVPAPTAGSNIRYLCADGTWKEVDLDSAKTKLVVYS